MAQRAPLRSARLNCLPKAEPDASNSTQSPAARSSCQGQSDTLGLGTTVHEKDIRGCNRREPSSVTLRISLRGGFQHQQQPFHAKSPSDGRGLRTSQLTNQTVITTTSADGGLGTELITGDLKSRVAVVIQATHQPWIEPKGNPQSIQPALHLFKTFTACVRESIRQGWRSFQQRLGVLVFGIQDAQGIGAQPCLGIRIEGFERCSSQATRASR